MCGELAALADSLGRCQARQADAVLAEWEAGLRAGLAGVAGSRAELERQVGWYEAIRGVLAGDGGVPLAVGEGRRAAREEQLEQVLAGIRVAAEVTVGQAAYREHLLGVTERYRAGLFVCDAVAGVPGTNNAHEGVFGQVRRQARQQTGFKQIRRVLQRHGAWLVYEVAGSVEEEQARAAGVGAAAYTAERARFAEWQARFRGRHRWRQRPAAVLAGLEAQWEDGCANSTQ